MSNAVITRLFNFVMNIGAERLQRGVTIDTLQFDSLTGQSTVNVDVPNTYDGYRHSLPFHVIDSRRN